MPSDNPIEISVIDNLLLINCENEYMSIIYDIKRDNSNVPIGPP